MRLSLRSSLVLWALVVSAPAAIAQPTVFTYQGRLTGIRHDAFAEANRIPVVQDKGTARGTYLHPDLYPR